MNVTQILEDTMLNTTENQSSVTQLLGKSLSGNSSDLFLVIPLLVIGPGTIFANLLMIHVLYRMYMPTLRKTTRLLLGYVSTSHCVLAMGTVARLFRAPCSFLAMLATFSGTNILNGQFLLACEVFVMVVKPYTYQKIFTLRLCKLTISIMSMITIGIFPLGYMTLKEPSVPSLKGVCYLTNGMFSSLVLTITTSIIEVMVIVTTIIQCYVLRSMRTVVKRTGHQASTVAHTSSTSLPTPAPNMLANTVAGPPAVNISVKKTRLHKLTIILTVSLLCFIICWSPTLIGIIVFSVCDLLGIEASVASQIMPKFSTLITINGALHVAVYLSMSAQIRDGIKDVIRSCCCH